MEWEWLRWSGWGLGFRILVSRTLWSSSSSSGAFFCSLCPENQKFLSSGQLYRRLLLPIDLFRITFLNKGS